MSLPPLLPFTRPDIDEATIADVAAVLRSGWITTGPKCREFEAALSRRFADRPVRVLSSGTAALELGLRLAGVGSGDEVITCPLSWVATANVILALGAKPVFVDAEARTRLIDIGRIEAAISARTRAIIPVDLAGLPVDRDALYALAGRHGLRVVEDAAQSLGSRWRGKAIGSAGDLVAFSFHANKNLTTAEGGCLVVNDATQALALERLRLQGVRRQPDGQIADVVEWGDKANLSDVAAAIGLGQLRRLDAFTQRRHALAKRYFELWDRSLGCELPGEEYESGNWHMFQPLLPLARMRISRSEFIARMRQRHAIAVGVHYPAMHRFSLFAGLGYRGGDFPVAEHIGDSTITLPLFPAMRDDDVDRVCTAVSATLREALQ